MNKYTICSFIIFLISNNLFSTDTNLVIKKRTFRKLFTEEPNEEPQQKHQKTESTPNFPMPLFNLTTPSGFNRTNSTSFTPATPKKPIIHKKSIENILAEKKYSDVQKLNVQSAKAELYKAKNSDNESIILKVFNINDRKSPKLNNEVREVKELNSPNVLMYKNHYYETTEKIFIIEMPFYEKGSLKSYLEKIVLSEQKILSFIIDIATGLAEMARKKVCHLDMKPDNLLVDDNENILIADFGKIKKFGQNISSGGGGDARYAAFEIKDHETTANEKLDIVGFGFSILEIVSTKPLPTANMNEFEKIRTDKEYVKSSYFDKVQLSEDLINLILNMIDQKPHNRPSAQQIIEEANRLKRTHESN